jgi:ubiquinone/menaquinone biosynthesis C-methylase UbiE/8-oxo-dGTP pyrophosphatase MutT (NUDIX family)
MSNRSTVEQFYDTNALTEWTRLERHPTEFAVTMRALEEWLPPAPGAILDIGGGPGRYAIELARRGYDVTLLDLSQGNLDFAKARAAEAGVTLKDYVHGNALDLSRYPKRSFDAALLMGPLYHLFSSEDQRRAVGEAWRVLRPAGMLFAACITRYAAIRDSAVKNPAWLVERPAVVQEFLETGILRLPPLAGFTDHYAAHPLEFAPLIESAGFSTQALIGVEGVVAGVEDNIARLNGEAWDAWVDVNYRLGHDPSLHGGAFHLLYVGRKQGRFASAIVRRGDEILLQQAQGPDDVAPCWYIPGGSVEAHESFEQAAIREVREETGIEVLDVASLAYSVHMRHTPSERGGTAHIYDVTDWRGEIVVDDPDEVTLQARFVPVAEAIALLETTLPYRNMRDPLLGYLRGDARREWRYLSEDDGEMQLVNL